MRKYLFTVLVFVILSQNSGAANRVLSETQTRDLQEFLSQCSLKTTKCTIIYFNTSDCGNCLSNVQTRFNDTLENVVILSHYAGKQLAAMKSEFNLSDKFCYRLVEELPNSIRESLVGKSSSVIKINGCFMQITELHKYTGNKYFPYQLEPRNLVSYDDTSSFLSGFSGYSRTDDYTYASTYPKSKLVVFNREGKQIWIGKLQNKQLKEIQSYFTQDLEDSLMRLNNFDTCLNVFTKRLEPLGFSTLSVHSVQVHDQNIVFSGVVSFPVFVSEEKVQFRGMPALITFDSNKHPLEISKIQVFPKYNIPDRTAFGYNYLSIDSSEIVIGVSNSKEFDYPTDRYFAMDYKYANLDGRLAKSSDSLTHFVKVGSFNKPLVDSLKNLFWIHSDIQQTQGIFFQYHPTIVFNTKDSIDLDKYRIKNLYQLNLFENNFHNHTTIKFKENYYGIVSLNSSNYFVKYDTAEHIIESFREFEISDMLIRAVTTNEDQVCFYGISIDGQKIQTQIFQTEHFTSILSR